MVVSLLSFQFFQMLIQEPNFKVYPPPPIFFLTSHIFLNGKQEAEMEEF